MCAKQKQKQCIDNYSLINDKFIRTLPNIGTAVVKTFQTNYIKQFCYDDDTMFALAISEMFPQSHM